MKSWMATRVRTLLKPGRAEAASSPLAPSRDGATSSARQAPRPPLWSHPLFWLTLLAGLLFARFKPWDGQRLAGLPQTNWDDYLELSFRSFGELLHSERTFGYPFFLKGVRTLTPSLEALPLSHLLVHVLAAFVFYLGLRRIHFSKWLALALAGSVLYSRTLLTYGWYIMADSLGLSLAVMTIGALFLVVGRPRSVPAWLALTASLFLTYQVRPAYLFLVGLVPLLGMVLLALITSRAEWVRQRRVVGAGLVAAACLPYLAWCTFRWAAVGHFGLVSFGGYALVYISGLWLTEDVVPDLPPDMRPLAQAVLRDRPHKQPDWPAELPDWLSLLDRDGCFDFGLVNDEERFAEINIASGRLYLRNAGRLYGGKSGESVSAATGPGVDGAGDRFWWIDPRWDWVAVEGKLKEMALALVKARPSFYLKWLAAASRAGLTRIVVTNTLLKYLVLLQVVLLGVWQALYVIHRLRRGPARAPAEPGPAADYSLQLNVMALLAVSFALGALLQCILVAPPMSRYMGAAGVFLPGVVVVGLFAVAARVRALVPVALGRRGAVPVHGS